MYTTNEYYVGVLQLSTPVDYGCILTWFSIFEFYSENYILSALNSHLGGKIESGEKRKNNFILKYNFKPQQKKTYNTKL